MTHASRQTLDVIRLKSKCAIVRYRKLGFEDTDEIIRDGRLTCHGTLCEIHLHHIDGQAGSTDFQPCVHLCRYIEEFRWIFEVEVYISSEFILFPFHDPMPERKEICSSSSNANIQKLGRAICTIWWKGQLYRAREYTSGV